MRRCDGCHHDFDDDAFLSARARYCRVCERVRSYDDDHHTDTSLMALQSRCDICGDSSERLEVDHDHNPDLLSFEKKVRGLLCPNCNKALGHLKDDPACAIRAALYLIDSNNLGTLTDEKQREITNTSADARYGLLSHQLDRMVERYHRITPTREDN